MRWQALLIAAIFLQAGASLAQFQPRAAPQPPRIQAPQGALRPVVPSGARTVVAGELSVVGLGATNGVKTIEAGQLSVVGLGAAGTGSKSVDVGQLGVVGLGTAGTGTKTVEAGQLSVTGTYGPAPPIRRAP